MQLPSQFWEPKVEEEVFFTVLREFALGVDNTFFTFEIF
jgi:hypothetical protein